MVKKVRFKFPLLLVSILIVLLGSLLILPVFADEQLVSNGGFESGYTGWLPVGGYESRMEIGSPITGNQAAVDTWLDSYSGNCFYQIFDTGILGANITSFEFNWTSNGTHPNVFYEIIVSLCWQYQDPQWSTYYDNYNIGKDGVVQAVSFNVAGFPQDDYLVGIMVELIVGSYALGTEQISVDDISIQYSTGGTSTAPVVDTTADLIASFMAILVPLLLFLIPAYFLGVYLKMGVVGIVFGVTVGASLGYVFLPQYVQLWMLFLVVICDVAVAYRSLR